MFVSVGNLKTPAEIEAFLVQKQRQVESQLRLLEDDDPVLIDDAPEPSELGTDAWQAEVHAKTVVLKSKLNEMMARIKLALSRLKAGTYGQCEQCGQYIEPERLQIIPTATLCLGCVSVVSKF